MMSCAKIISSLPTRAGSAGEERYRAKTQTPSSGLETISAVAPSTSAMRVPGPSNRIFTGSLIPRPAASAPSGQLVPAFGFHEFGPAPVEVAQIVLAGLRFGDVHDRPWNVHPLPFVFLGLEADALLVAV